LESEHLRLDNLGGFLVITHSSAPNKQATQSLRSNHSDFLLEKFLAVGSGKSEIRLEQFDGLVVNVILGFL
jgi:hypothetical protein